MVAKLARFRVALLFAFFGASAKQKLTRFAWLAAAFFAAFVLAWLPMKLASDESLVIFDVLTGSLVLAAGFLFPFFVTGLSFKTRYLQQIAAAPSRLATATLFTGVLTWPFLWVLVWLVSFAVLRKEIYGLSYLTLLVYLAVALLLLTVTRLLSSATELFFDTERRTKSRNVLGVLLLLSILPVAFYFLIAELSVENLAEISAFIGWSPVGLPFMILQQIAAGETLGAMAAFGVLVAAIALLTGLALSLMIRELRTVAKPEMIQLQQVKLGWFEVFSAQPVGAIGARAMIYWLRDPRYTVSLIAIPVIPFVIVLILKFVGVSVDILAFFPLPIVLIMIGWMLHNDIANDSTAFWLHVSSGIKGWQDRLGRLIPVFIFGIPIILIGAGASVILSGEWKLLPSFFALGFSAMGAAACMSSITSILLPYPATRPDESPFVQPQWQGAGAGFAQTVALIGSAVLTGPAIVVIALSVNSTTLQEQFFLMLSGVLYSALLVAVGVIVGGNLFNRRAADVLFTLQTYD